MTVEDPWAWLDETEPEQTLDLSGHRVTAVLVAHNGAAWLPATLTSLAALTLAPTRFLAVDAGSDDGTAELLHGSGLFDKVVTTGADPGFGGAVAEALREEPEPSREPGTASDGADDRPAGDWLWLLHDDVTVAPDALAQLLTRVSEDPTVDIAGPKLLNSGRGGEPATIAELGVSISDTARIDPQTEPDEVDQHQRKSETVLAVNSCAMLVRRSVFTELGGLAPEVPVFTDGLEFGWRATEAGHKVVTAPRAAVTHRGAGRSGLRTSPLIGGHPERTRRLMAMRTVAAHRGPASSLRLLWGSVLRALGFLLGKAPGRSADELAAAAAFLGGGAVRGLRRRRRATDAGRATAKSLRPPWWSSWQVGADAVGTWVGLRWRELVGDRGSDTSLDELTGGDFAGSDHPTRSRWFGPFGVTLIALVVLSLVAARETIASGRLASTLLLPSRVGLADAYAAHLAPIAGSPAGAAPPWLGWVALGSTLTLGRPEFFSTLAIVLAPPMAMVTGYLLLRRVVSDRRVAVVAALFGALVPVMIGATGRGALAASTFAVLLPLFVICVRSLLAGRAAGVESWRPVFAGGVLASILVSSVPATVAPMLLLALVGCLLRRDRIAQIVVLVAIPLVLLAPWWVGLRHSMSRILLGPDAALNGTAAPEHFWQLAIGHTPGAGAAPLWVAVAFFGVIWLAAIVAAAVAGFDAPVLLGWAVGGGALLVAVLLSGELATAAPFGTQVRPELLSWLVIGFGALVLAAASGVDAVPRILASRSFGAGHLAAAAGSALTVLVLLGSAGWWVVATDAPLHRDPQNEIAPYIRNSQTSPAGTRTLALRMDGDKLSYALVEGDLPRLGDADRGFAFAGSTTMQSRTSSIVARLAAGSGDAELATELSSLAVGHVWVSGASQEQKTRIDNVPGLGSASGDERAYVWTVPETTGRAVVEGGAEPLPVAVDDSLRGAAELPAADGPRRLVLREPTDPRWKVEFNGRPLEGVPGTDVTTFEVPSEAGQLHLRLDSPVKPWLALAQLVALLVLLVLAAPSVRRRRQQEPVGRRSAPSRVEAAPTQPVPAGSVTAQPERTDPEPTEPVSTEPEPAEPVSTEPEPDGVGESRPAATREAATHEAAATQAGARPASADQPAEPAAPRRGRRVAEDEADGGTDAGEDPGETPPRRGRRVADQEGQ